MKERRPRAVHNASPILEYEAARCFSSRGGVKVSG